MKTLDKDTSDKVNFMAFIIPEFARSYKMGIQDAYRYLKKYGGIDYLNQCWWALHTDNPFWAVRDMFEVCKNNGGKP
jgi:hypothetical protein